MKKGKTTILLVLFALTALIAVTAEAATLTFSSASVSVKEGQTFYLTVSVNPQGAKSTTVKMELKFPSDLLKVKSFNFASNSSWIALAQPGYDLVDNTSGVLIKTAGYPGSVSAPLTFGTVSFTAKRAGSGVISSGSGTLVLDASNANVFSGAGQVLVVVAAPAVVSATETPVGAISSPSPSPSPGLESQAEQATTPSTLASILTLGTNKTWLGALVVIVVLALVAYIVTRSIRRKKSKV